MKVKKILIAAALAAAVILLLNACATAEPPLRLHIKANSNSETDQQIKLIVRDAVLETTKDIARCENEEEAEEYIENNLGIILETANKTLLKNGFEYSAGVEVGRFQFPQKSYRGVTYPEGEYEALRITLGEGEGDNWWCVMFPPLCLSEVTEVKDAEYTSIFAELWETLFGS